MAAGDHKSFLSELPATERTRLTARSDLKGLLHLAGHLGLIVVTGVLIAARVPLWPVLLPVHGVLLVFLFSPAHECTHRTPFARDWLSDLVGTLCGIVLILPFQWFRAFHLAHHRHTNLPDLDPELASPRPRTRRAWLWHVSGLPFWISQTRVLFLLAFGRGHADYLPPSALPRMQREARAILGFYCLAAASLAVTPLLFWVWILPVILGQPALRLFLLAEHGDCPQVADMFRNTRTTFTTTVMRFLSWNMPYHTEHHVFPQVPFFRLPAMHGLMRLRLGVTADGYVTFTRDYLARRS